jgi:carboxynorspermidine decarboxylase
MDRDRTLNLDLDRLPSPCFVIDKEALQENMSIVDAIRKKTGVKILLALKGFAMFSVFDVLRPHLSGVCASSPHEARLGYEEMGKEVHAFAAAYSQKDIEDFLQWSDHIVFNSFTQWQRFGAAIKKASRTVSCGIRINPEHSEGSVPIYDPCALGSRLGVIRANFKRDLLEGLEGLHFHTLCEHNADALERTLVKVEEKFGEYMAAMKWINFGGGHHITRSDYDLDLLCRLINEFKSRYKIKEIYMEPGEAIVFEAGYFVASVLDIIENDMPIAILNTSAAAHMPDVLEMPYRPNIINAGNRGEKAYNYRLGGLSCLAGDIIGEYSFERPLTTGDKLVFTDMAHYSMVKTNTFNGIKLPSIAWYDRAVDRVCIVRDFGYEDYKKRLS